MCYLIEITDETGDYVQSPLITSISIEKSIKNLADIATIQAAIFHLNEHIEVEDGFQADKATTTKLYKLYKRGQKISIHLGYNDELRTEFVGYIKEVKTDGEGMTIECEDELFIFRKTKIPDKKFSETGVKTIARYVCDRVNKKINIICDYDMVYESFTIYKATGLDVLSQLQQDTGADIYFKTNTSGNVGNVINLTDVNGIRIIEEEIQNPKVSETLELHIRMPYMKKNTEVGNVYYSMQHNIEESNLEYVDTTDKKVKIKITTSKKNGTVETVEYGNTGGEEFEYKINRISTKEMKARAKQEFEKQMKPGYTGDFKGWLIPYCEPNYSIGIDDEDFPEKSGIYNVDSVNIEFSESGGVRTITPGIKLSRNK